MTAAGVAAWLGITEAQAEELRFRLNQLCSEGEGFGSVRVDVRRSQIYRISVVVEGKPMVFGKEDS